MKNLGVLFGTGMVYIIYLVVLASAGMYLIAHIPETFDLGYVGMVLVYLFALAAIIKSISMTCKDFKD